MEKAGELRSSLTKTGGAFGSKVLVPAERVQEIEDRIAGLEAAVGNNNLQLIITRMLFAPLNVLRWRPGPSCDSSVIK